MSAELDGLAVLNAQAVAEAYSVVERMVNPAGCAWHEAQTHTSLVRYLVEETYEFIAAVEAGAGPAEVGEELADLLYQVLLHAAIAARNGEGYDLQSVATTLTKKLKDRHPHVFGDRGYMSLTELEAQWERLKEDAAGRQTGSREVLEGVPESLPSLARAAKVIDRLNRAGLLAGATGDLGVPAQPKNTNAQPASATQPVDTNAAAEAANAATIGQELLAIVQKAQLQGIDPDQALRLATNELIASKQLPSAKAR